MDEEKSLENFLDSDLQEIAKDLQRFQGDARYFDNNYESLRRKYPDQFVAIYNGEVVANNIDIASVAKKLNEKGLRGKAFVRRTYYKEKQPKFIFATAQ